MLGQLVDAGNTVTLAHYLQLLEGVGMVAGLQKFSGTKIRQRAYSPKLQVLNTALISSKPPPRIGFPGRSGDHRSPRLHRPTMEGPLRGEID